MRSAALGENCVTFGAFRIGGAYYGIDVAQLREVVRWKEPTLLPRSPRLIEGVVDLRGTVLPVVDLGRALGRDRATSGAQARLAIVEVDGLLLGLAVDRAEGVMSLDVGMLEDPPALATHAGYDAVRAVVRQPDAPPLLLLSLESVLETVYRSPSAAREEAVL